MLLQAAAALAAMLACVGFFLYYVVLFGTYQVRRRKAGGGGGDRPSPPAPCAFAPLQSAATSTQVVIAWAWSQAFAALVVHPLLSLGGLLLSFGLCPPIEPYVAWLPGGVGRTLAPAAAAAAAAANDGPQGALTRRLAQVTLLRAAAAAAGLPPDAAAVALGDCVAAIAPHVAVAEALSRGRPAPAESGGAADVADAYLHAVLRRADTATEARVAEAALDAAATRAAEELLSAASQDAALAKLAKAALLSAGNPLA